MATRQGLQARSFALAAESYQDAVGSPICKESVRQMTEGWGAQGEVRRVQEAEHVFDPNQPQAKNEIEVINPIKKQASISTDGGMVHLRGEGWKEAKLVAISAVRPKKEHERNNHPDGRRYAPWEPQMMLEAHSYQAGLWSADEMEPHQYLEGLRRAIPRCAKTSSVNDAAEWIERITGINFPHTPQIVDWFHAAEKMWLIGKAVIAPTKEAIEAWVQSRLDDLWLGDLTAVNASLKALNLDESTHPEEVVQAIGYFDRQQERMKYHQYRVAGYPIGSGSVESGINNVVHHRLKRQGPGWKRQNAHVMLAALSELHSGRFDHAWRATHASG